MKKTKFSMNALLLILLLFSVLAFFCMVTLDRLASQFPVNDYIPIENSEYAVRHSSIAPSGICRGGKNTAELLVEGNFGSGWGAYANGDTLLLNEYRNSRFGFLFCDLMRVDVSARTKSTLYENTVLRGVCASGEPVCVRGALLPAVHPETNALCRLYRLSAGSLSVNGEAEVLFLDPETLTPVFSVREPGADADDFEARYLSRTLEEVRACASASPES